MNDVDLAVMFAREMPYKIAREIGFKDVREYPHNEWMREIITGKADYTLLAHRGSYKSSVLSVCIALIMVLMPYQNIIFLRKADDDVSEMIRMVKKALESEVIQSLALILYKKRIILTESTTSSITTNLFMSASGASQLLGIGLKSSITGKHADLVITDDICNINDRVSRAEREKTKTQFQELRNVCNRGGRIVSLGTKWHEEDVFTLMRNIHVYTYQDTNLISAEEIAVLKESMSPSLFACNYELKIVADDDVIFTEPQTGADPALAEQGNSHVDAAFYGEDYTAFTAMAIHDGKFYVFGKLWRKHIDDVMDECVMWHEKFLCGKMYNELNADKGYVAKQFRQKGLKVATYTEHQNKYVKIVSYLKFEWKNVIFVAGTDEAYINMICDYNENAEHDDAPDSLASLIRIMGRRKELQQYQSIFEG